MARTAEGKKLTDQHRTVQLAIRAGALRDFTRFWPIWTGEEKSFRRLIEASVPLVRQYHSTSAAAAASYYEKFRVAEDPGGTATPKLPQFDAEKTAAGLYVTGKTMTQAAIQAGQTPQAAMQNALVRASGSVTRQVLNGGRGTLVLSTSSDKMAGGYGRVTGGDCCAFCAMIASRGPVFSEDTADFEAHDHCACMGEPSYPGSEWPGQSGEFRDLWNDTVKTEMRYDKGRKRMRQMLTKDAFNDFRRAYEASRV